MKRNISIFPVISFLIFSLSLGALSIQSLESTVSYYTQRIPVKEYYCHSCNKPTALNGSDSTAKLQNHTHNGGNFKPVIRSVKDGKYTLIIETDRLILRAATLDDIDDIYEWAQKEEVAQSMTWKRHATREKTVRTVKKWIKDYQREYMAPLVFELKENGKVIGAGGMHTYYPGTQRVVGGWSIDSAYWNRGLGTEVARAIIEVVFGVAKFNRFEAIARVDNIGSIRVLEKAGMSYEGTFRDYWLVKDEMLDMHQYAVIASDVEEQMKHSVCNKR